MGRKVGNRIFQVGKGDFQRWELKKNCRTPKKEKGALPQRIVPTNSKKKTGLKPLQGGMA